MDFSKLFYQAPQPMWVFDPDTLQFLDVNEAAVLNYGYSKFDFSIMTIADIRPLEELPKLSHALANVKGDHSFSQPFRHLRRDGTIIDVHVTLYEIDWDDSWAYLTIAKPTIPPEAMTDHLQQLIGKLEFTLLNRIAQDRKRFAEIWSLAVELSLESVSARQTALSGRIRQLAADMPGNGLN